MHILVVRAMFLLFWVLLGFLIGKRCWVLSKSFSCIYGNDHVTAVPDQPRLSPSAAWWTISPQPINQQQPFLPCAASGQWLAHGDKRSDWVRHSEQFKLEMKGTNHVVIYSQSLRYKYLGINLRKYLQYLNTETHNTQIKKESKDF